MKLPFHLKGHQLQGVDAWISNGMRGSIIYSSGTGKTEIAFEWSRRAAALLAPKNSSNSTELLLSSNKFNILFVVPRIVLIFQNLRRLTSYGIPREKIGIYFGEKKEADREIIVGTYQSIVSNPALIKRSRMVIFDEVHLVSETAKVLSKIFDLVLEDDRKALLGLTATINLQESKFHTIATVLPPVKK